MGSKLDDIQSPTEKDKAEKAVARTLAIVMPASQGSAFLIPASYPRPRAMSVSIQGCEGDRLTSASHPVSPGSSSVPRQHTGGNAALRHSPLHAAPGSP